MKKTISKNGAINRYISEIGFLHDGKMANIYSNQKGKVKYFKLSDEALDYLDLESTTEEFKKLFLGDKT